MSEAEEKKKALKKYRAKIAAALTMYKNGQVAAATDALDALAKRTISRQRAKAKRLAEAIARFELKFKRGLAASEGMKRPAKALKPLRAARTLDASINRAYAGRIKRELADVEAHLASTAWSSKRYGKAGRHAKKALALNANQTQAKRVLGDVQAKVDGWLSEGKQAARSNPDRASTLLTRVVSILPSSDGRYKEAYRLLNQLAANEEE